jgi:hypothetical protein
VGSRKDQSPLAALFVVGEELILPSQPDEARAMARMVYVTLFKVWPPPDGQPIPDRFLPKR